jgi:hypothetical protein
MVVVKLNGGMGNQLFQYAAGRRLSILHRTPLKLDISWFESQRLRSYSLGPFRTIQAFASPKEIAAVKGDSKTGLAGPIFRWRQRCKPYYRRSVFSEVGGLGPYDPNTLRANSTVYLDGYWQSEKYFLEIQEIIRQEFAVSCEQDPENQKVAAHIMDVPSVSVHVRRGDYVSDPGTNNVHGTCSSEYYHRALRLLMEKVHAPHAFIFSDDARWVADNLQLACPTSMVSHNGADKAYEDLRLMSMCKHHIIANSSFSWWGAWLCANPRKIVIAPQRWLLDARYDTKDLIPSAWSKI